MEKRTYNIEGMACSSCEEIIENTLLKLEGVKKAKATLAENEVEVEFNSRIVGEKQIKEALREAGYPVKSEGRNNVFVALGALALFVGLYLALEYASTANGFDFAKIDANTSYAILFTVGLFTGLHCIAMCGGFVLSFSTKEKNGNFTPHLSYAIGKMISYTAIGAFLGLLGSFIAFTIEMRITVAVLAGLFLIIYGLGMLNVIPKFLTTVIKVPGSLDRFRTWISKRGPFSTGVATGFFVACGPLQTMYVLAAGSGSPVFGALALFFFGLGTLPVLLGFSYASNLISRALATRINRYSGILIVLLGMVMLNNALVLSGVQLVPTSAAITGAGFAQGSELFGRQPDLPFENSAGKDIYQVIRMNVTRYGWEPDTFVLKKGIPVKWIINGLEITSCNNEIIIREYGLDIKVKKGEQTVEFTPTQTKNVSWSCWMGMIPGKFIVVEGNATQEIIQAATASADSTTKTGSCSCGTGDRCVVGNTGSCGGTFGKVGCGCDGTD